jgi:hypothetical protein
MRLTPRLLVVPIALAMVFAGCGGDDDDRASGSPSDEPTETTAPNTTTTAPAAPVLEGEELRSVLLEVSDLPTGWSTMPDEPDDEPGDDNLCNDKPAPFPEDDNEEEIGFSGGANDVPLLFNLAASGPEDEMAEKFAFLEAALSECVGETWDTTEDGETTTYSLRDMSFPELGDDSLAFSMRAEAQFGTIEFGIVAVRRRTLVSVLMGAGANLPMLGLNPFPEGVLEDAARRATEKMDAALEA